jgi:ATP synthase protein I
MIGMPALGTNNAAAVGRLEPIIAAGSGETHPIGAAAVCQIHRKCLKSLLFPCTAGGSPFLDSPQPNHYGPRGLKRRQELPGFAHNVAVSKAGPITMADDTHEASKSGNRSAEEAALSARLQRLGDRLAQQRTSRKVEADPPPSTNASGLAQGLRLSTELVAGVLVGAGIGWLLDRWLGISPWGFIVFLLLGFAAGLLNVMRSAGVLAEQERSGKQ